MYEEKIFGNNPVPIPDEIKETGCPVFFNTTAVLGSRIKTRSANIQSILWEWTGCNVVLRGCRNRTKPVIIHCN